VVVTTCPDIRLAVIAPLKIKNEKKIRPRTYPFFEDIKSYPAHMTRAIVYIRSKARPAR
jgi:hypothetical protein